MNALQDLISELWFTDKNNILQRIEHKIFILFTPKKCKLLINLVLFLVVGADVAQTNIYRMTTFMYFFSTFLVGIKKKLILFNYVGLDHDNIISPNHKLFRPSFSKPFVLVKSRVYKYRPRLNIIDNKN